MSGRVVLTLLALLVGSCALSGADDDSAASSGETEARAVGPIGRMAAPMPGPFGPVVVQGPPPPGPGLPPSMAKNGLPPGAQIPMGPPMPGSDEGESSEFSSRNTSH